MGWQVDAFHVQQEEGGLYVPLLHRVIPDNQYCIEDFHTNGSLATMVSRAGWREAGNGTLTHSEEEKAESSLKKAQKNTAVIIHTQETGNSSHTGNKKNYYNHI